MEEPFIRTFTPSHDPSTHRENRFQLIAVPLYTPFRRIAMALSGGGFRAASFSIGAMSYLNRLPYGEGRTLLDNVEFISSASGGTFPAIIYSVYAKKGIPFITAYKDMLGFMEGETLLEEVLRLLDNDSEWIGEEKNRNLINAFARTYDSRLFKGETFGVYWGKGIGAGALTPNASKSAGSAVQRNIEVCFNATEFTRGLSFRWQTNGGLGEGDDQDAGTTGNNYIYVDKDAASHLETLQQVKLGDIMASSSCFPGGFEPVMYPEDFSYPATRDGKQQGSGLSADKLRRAMVVKDYDNRERILEGSIGLMDGGVNDNQGLYSAILADVRRRRPGRGEAATAGAVKDAAGVVRDTGEGFDLMMVSDVASYFMDPYLPPKAAGTGAWRNRNVLGIFSGLNKLLVRINRWLRIVLWVGLALLAGSIALLVQPEQGVLRNLGFLFLSPAILLLLFWVAVTMGRKFIPQIGRIASLLDASDKELLEGFKEQVPAAGVLSDAALGSLGGYLRTAKFSVLEQMLKTRLNSTLSMVMDINLKQTRRLIFDIFFGNFYGQDVWANRRSFNVIYELSEFNKVNRDKLIRNKFRGDAVTQGLLLDGCLELNDVAEDARTMGTTLWYDHTDAKEQRMKKVVACGQFNTCAKLLEYVLDLEQTMKHEAGLPEAQRSIVLSAEERVRFDGVKLQLLKDWDAFKRDPYFLFDEMEK